MHFAIDALSLGLFGRPVPEIHVIVIWNFQGRLAAILDLIEPEIAPFDLPTRKPHASTKHEMDRMTRYGDIAIRNFQHERLVFVVNI